MECASWPVCMHPCAHLNMMYAPYWSPAVGETRACGFTFGFKYAICEFALENDRDYVPCDSRASLLLTPGAHLSEDRTDNLECIIFISVR